MTKRFDVCFERVVGHEGGYTTDRNDRGNWTSGKIGVGQLKGTKYGVSAMAYPSLDIKNLTLAKAKEIYKKDYWDACRCDDLPVGPDYLVFDSAINHGNKKARQLLQEAVGATPDGIIGPKTLAAVKAKSKVKLCDEFCVRRGLFYAQIGTFDRYGLGWFRRLMDTHRIAILD